MGNNFRHLSCISVSSFWSGGLKCRRTKDISNFMSEFMFHAFRVCLCEVGFATAEVRVKSQNFHLEGVKNEQEGVEIE